MKYLKNLIVFFAVIALALGFSTSVRAQYEPTTTPEAQVEAEGEVGGTEEEVMEDDEVMENGEAAEEEAMEGGAVKDDEVVVETEVVEGEILSIEGDTVTIETETGFRTFTTSGVAGSLMATLEVGDSVKVKVASASTEKGTVTVIEDDSVTVETEDGSTKTYTSADSNVRFIRGEETVALSDLESGDEVTVITEGDQLVDVEQTTESEEDEGSNVLTWILIAAIVLAVIALVKKFATKA